jgi:hypothetical protein
VRTIATTIAMVGTVARVMAIQRAAGALFEDVARRHAHDVIVDVPVELRQIADATQLFGGHAFARATRLALTDVGDTGGARAVVETGCVVTR